MAESEPKQEAEPEVLVAPAKPKRPSSAAMLRSVCTLARQLSVLEIGLPLVVFDLQWFLRLYQVRVTIRFCFQSSLQSSYTSGNEQD